MCLIEMLLKQKVKRKRRVAEQNKREIENGRRQRRSIGTALRNFRESVNITQREIAEHLGIAVDRLNRLEHGSKCDDWEVLVERYRARLESVMEGRLSLLRQWSALPQR